MNVWRCNRCSSASTLAVPLPPPHRWFPLPPSLPPCRHLVLNSVLLRTRCLPPCGCEPCAHPPCGFALHSVSSLPVSPSIHPACNYRPPYPMDPYKPFSLVDRTDIFVLKALSVTWFCPPFFVKLLLIHSIRTLIEGLWPQCCHCEMCLYFEQPKMRENSIDMFPLQIQYILFSSCIQV